MRDINTASAPEYTPGLQENAEEKTPFSAPASTPDLPEEVKENAPFSAPEPTPGLLIHEIAKLFHDRMRIHAERIGLAPGARPMLMFLAHRDGVSQLDLVNAAHCTAPTVSVTLRKMEADGLVTRKTDEVDQRQTRVFLTEKGRALDHQLHARVMETEALLQVGLSDAEKEATLALLTRLRDNMLHAAPAEREAPHCEKDS